MQKKATKVEGTSQEQVDEGVAEEPQRKRAKVRQEKAIATPLVEGSPGVSHPHGAKHHMQGTFSLVIAAAVHSYTHPVLSPVPFIPDSPLRTNHRMLRIRMIVSMLLMMKLKQMDTKR